MALDSVSGESPFSGSQTAVFSQCPHIAEGALWGLFCRDTDPIHEGSTPMT